VCSVFAFVGRRCNCAACFSRVLPALHAGAARRRWGMPIFELGHQARSSRRRNWLRGRASRPPSARARRSAVFVLMLFRLALFVCDRFLLPLFSPETLLFLLSSPRHLPISTFLAFAFRCAEHSSHGEASLRCASRPSLQSQHRFAHARLRSDLARSRAFSCREGAGWENTVLVIGFCVR
jgi:hypothetical protein